MNVISEFLNALDTQTIPDRLRQQVPFADGNYEEFKAYAEDFSGPVYGTNTLPGHRDAVLLKNIDQDSYQLELVRKHCIGGAPYLSHGVTKAITLAKAYGALAGGATISGASLEIIFDAFESPDFRPKVPSNSSYSSGDVIPAAHWAASLLDWNSRRDPHPHLLGPGEGMALINGAFVHVGTTAALCASLKEFWPFYVEVLRWSLTTMGADARSFRYPHGVERSWATRTCEYISSDLTPRPRDRQEPVSLRTTLQVVEALTAAINTLFSECNYYIEKPSGNPLFFRNPTRMHVPSGSFLNPVLTIFAGTVIETLLMAGWASVQRINYLLSGNVRGISIDASTPKDGLGLIQWPKNAQAKLEALRRECGTRSFVSGGSTSYGIEDMWSFGLYTAQLGLSAVQQLRSIINIELYCSLFAGNASGLELPFEMGDHDLLQDKFATEQQAQAVADTLASRLDPGRIPFLADEHPFGG